NEPYLSISAFGFRISDFFDSGRSSIPQSEIQNPKFLLGSSILQNHLLRDLVTPRLVTTRRLSPRRHRITTTGSLTFTTAVWVIDRVHRNAANFRSQAFPA